MPIGNESALVASIVFDIKHQVDSYLFKASGGSTRFSQVLEGPIFVELFHLKAGGVLPLCVAIPEVQCHCMEIISCHFVPILVSGCCLVGSEFGLVNHAEELLVPLGKASEPLPSIRVKKIIVPGIDGTCDRIIGSNDREGFGGYLPILPFDGDVECGSLVVGSMGSKGPSCPVMHWNCQSLVPGSSCCSM